MSLHASGLGLGSDILNALRNATSLTATPDSYFRFDDTPLFPVVNRSLGSANLVAASGSTGSAAANAPGMVAGSRGYSWSVWLRLSRVRDNATNLFSFLAENGCGVQSFIQQNKIRVRCLPNASETAPCNRATLPLNRWFFLAVVHVPAFEKRPAQLNVYLDGAHTDQIDMEYPVCPPGSLQCTVGGFSGFMAQFNFFSEPLSSKVTIVHSRYFPHSGCPHPHTASCVLWVVRLYIRSIRWGRARYPPFISSKPDRSQCFRRPSTLR